LVDSLTRSGEKTIFNFLDVELEGAGVLSEKMTFSISMRDEAAPGMGRIKAEVTFLGLTKAFQLENPGLLVKASFSTIDLAALRPYLEGSPPAQRLAGAVTLDITYETDFGKKQHVKGKADLTHLTYTDTSLWENPLPGVKTTLAFDVELAPDSVLLKHVDLSVGDLSLSGRARIETGGKSPVVKDAVFSGVIPLKQLAPFIPRGLLGRSEDVIHGMLQGGGQVTIEKAALPPIQFKGPPASMETFLSGLQIGARVSGLSIHPLPNIPKAEDITASIRFDNGIVKVEGLRARIGPATLEEVNGQVSNLPNKPHISAHARGRIQLRDAPDASMRELLERAGIEKVTGTAEMDLSLELDTARVADFELQGEVKVRDLDATTTHVPIVLKGLSADIQFTPRDVTVSKCSAAAIFPPDRKAPGGRFTFELSGRVENWHRQPQLSLHDFSTSPVSLPPLAYRLPPGQPGDAAEFVRGILLAGGEASVEELSFSRLDPHLIAEDAKALLSAMQGALKFSGLSIRTKPWLPMLQGITGQVNLRAGKLSASDVTMRMGPVRLPRFAIQAENLSKTPRVSIRATGPLQLAGGGNEEIDALLKRHGFSELTVDAETDLTGHIDLGDPEQWEGGGTLVLKKVHAKTRSGDVVLDNLRGRVALRRKNTLDLTIDALTGRLNRAPFHAKGRLSDVGTPHMLIDVSAGAKDLHLEHLASLVPGLKGLNPHGRLDLAVKAHIPARHPEKVRLEGNVKATGIGFRVPRRGIKVKGLGGELEFSGNAIDINNVTLIVNDQKLALSGRVENPLAPDIELNIASSSLDMDRLLPSGKDEKHIRKAGDEPHQRKPLEKKDKKQAVILPGYLSKTAAKIQLKSAQCRYGELEYEQLKMNVDYARGVLVGYDAEVSSGEGRVRVSGSADFRHPDRIPFTVKPEISRFSVERMSRAFGMEEFHLKAPLTASGGLKGIWAGTVGELLGSLEGEVDVAAGPGLVIEAGPMADAMGKALTLLSLHSIHFLGLKKELSGDGIPFDLLKGRVRVQDGIARIDPFQFESKSMNADGTGSVDLPKETVRAEIEFQPLTTVGKVMERIPLIGKPSASLLGVYMEVDGPLRDPRIRAAPARRLSKPLEEMIEAPRKAIEGAERQQE